MDIRYLDGKNKGVLIVAPHGACQEIEGKIEYRNDYRTGIIAEEIHKIMDCPTIINNSYIKPVVNKKLTETPSLKDKRLDLYKIKQAEQVPEYLNQIEKTANNHDGKTIVIWLHGISDGNANTEQKNIKGCVGDLHALIGYGQGKNYNRETEEDKNSRYTANHETIKTFMEELAKSEFNSHITRDTALNYRGRDLRRMNQWFLNKGYSLDNVETFQIEIREKGFRENEEQCRNSAKILAEAIKTILPKLHVQEAASNDNTSTLSVSPDAITQLPETAAQIVPSNEDLKSDDEVAEKAYQWLSVRFRKHLTDFFYEAGKYIIETFYNNDPYVAYIKNKAKDQPPSLNLLIKKIQNASKSPSDNTPSISWFYKAVSLGAHEMICEKEGLSTFTNLGHSHKLQLLYVPKIKEIPIDNINEFIKPAFQEKERLASEAVSKKLSVREFRNFINAEHPYENGKIDLLNLPDNTELMKLEKKALVRLQDKAKQTIDDIQTKLKVYQEAFNRINGVISKL